jgi:hypothetical protein
MPLPEEEQALQEVGTAQEGAVGRGGAADDDMVAAASPDMAAVDHELVGAEAALAGILVELRGDLDALAP